MNGYPKEWMRELRDTGALVENPVRREAELSAMAFASFKRGEVDEGQLSDMLEFAECAKYWAYDELDEGYRIGLFGDFPGSDLSMINRIVVRGRSSG